jgi:hypothetical protein
VRWQRVAGATFAFSSLVTANRSERGTGSLRERSPGVWEVRVVVGFDPARGRGIQRSVTVPGDAALAGTARRELVAGYGSTRSGVRHAASVVSVGELLEGYLGSDQFWRPATAASHRRVVSTLLGDPVCGCRLQLLTPAVMRAAICRWRGEGVSVPKVPARWLLIRSAVSWAVAEGMLALNPLGYSAWLEYCSLPVWTTGCCSRPRPAPATGIPLPRCATTPTPLAR